MPVQMTSSLVLSNPLQHTTAGARRPSRDSAFQNSAGKLDFSYGISARSIGIRLSAIDCWNVLSALTYASRRGG